MTKSVVFCPRNLYTFIMKTLSFFGAAGEVTGSSFLLTTSDDNKYLIDFGLFQGPPQLEQMNRQPLGFNPSELKAVFLTHGHLDHCGRLPLLIYGGYFGKIYMSAPTRAFVELILQDSAHIMAQDLSQAPLYTIDEVEKVMEMIEIVDYNTEIKIDNIKVTFRDAGHILGSSSIEIFDPTSPRLRGASKGTTIVFSGDLGNTPEDIVRPTTYIEKANIVVMETTYGDKEHPKEDVSKMIQDEINLIEQKGGVLLIPAFSIERTQEILHRINHLKKEGKIKEDTPVFMDSPMAIRATEIFKAFKTFYNDELQAHDDEPFSFEGLVITPEAKDSKEIITAHPPKVIIAGSGMMSGGRILHHAANYLSSPQTRVLFVGYQAEDTMGSAILHGARNVTINKKSVKVKAGVNEIKSLSSHADQAKLLAWLTHIQDVRKVFLVHGDTEQRETFAKLVKADNVVLPENGRTYEL